MPKNELNSLRMHGPRPPGNAFLATGPVPMAGAMVPGPIQIRSKEEVAK